MPRPSKDEGYFATRLPHSEVRAKAWAVLAPYLQRTFKIPEEGSVLDLGAGYGYFINNVNARERHALDASTYPLQRAAPEVKKHVGSCTDLSDFKNASLDCVFTSNLLEHLDRDEIDSTLRECQRVLKSSGLFLCIGPNYRLATKRYFDDYTHKTALSEVSLRDWLQSYDFKPEHVEAGFLPFSAEGQRTFNATLFKLYLALPWKPFAGQFLLAVRKT